MKKFLFCILSLPILISFSSCGSNEIQFEKKSYVSENGNIAIEYPIIKENTENKFNEYISGYVSKICSDLAGDEPDSFDIDIGYSVCFVDDVISVLFEGVLYYNASAHPVNVVYSVNYSIVDGKNIPFGELLDGKTKEDIAKCALGNDIISELYSEADILRYIEEAGKFGSQVCYYRTSDGTYITLPVPHAVGDYVKIKI